MLGGTEFDSSKPNEPHFRLGTQAIIQGVDEACVGMRVGEVERLSFHGTRVRDEGYEA